MRDMEPDRHETERLCSWLKLTSGFLTWIGIKLHHPNEKVRLTNKEARTFLQAVEAQIAQRNGVLKTLTADTARTNPSFENQYSDINSEKNLEDRVSLETARHDIAGCLRSPAYFKNIKNDIFSTNEHISSDTRKKPLTDCHLSQIKKNWQLLRVQYNILNLQVSGPTLRNIETQPSYSKTVQEAQGYQGEDKLFCPTEQLEYHIAEGEKRAQYSNSQIDQASQFSWTSLSSMEEVYETADARHSIRPNFANRPAGNSPRDDGYYSRAGESAADEASSFTDTQSIETDGTVQEKYDKRSEADVFMVPKTKVNSNTASSPEPEIFMVPKTQFLEECEVPCGALTPTSSSSSENDSFMVPKTTVQDKKDVKIVNTTSVTFRDPCVDSDDSVNEEESIGDPITPSSSYLYPKRDWTLTEVDSSSSFFMAPKPQLEKQDIKTTLNDVSSSFTTERYSDVVTDEWSELSKTVERFSQNTISLLSWIDELDEVNHDEAFSPKFFRSQSSRRGTVATHVERIYCDVTEDAAALLRTLPTERETLLTVLQNVETQCKKVGIFVGDDLEELSAIQPTKRNENRKLGFLSEEFKRDFLPPVSVSEELQYLAETSRSLFSYQGSYYQFKPQAASTPRHVDKTKDHFLHAISSPHTHDPEINRTKCFDSLVNRYSYHHWDHELSHRESHEARIKWIEFSGEYQPMLEWLEMMETVINRAETSRLSVCDIEKLFEKYLKQFEEHKTKRKHLQDKARCTEENYPELQQKIRIRMSDMDNLWNALLLRLTSYVTPLPFHQRNLKRQVLARIDPLLPIELYSYRGLPRISYLDILEWRHLSPYFDHNVQLSDFSYHQIRDRLYLGKPRKRWERILCERRSSSDRASTYEAIEETPPMTRELPMLSDDFPTTKSELPSVPENAPTTSRVPKKSPRHITTMELPVVTEDRSKNDTTPTTSKELPEVSDESPRNSSYDRDWIEFEGIEEELDRIQDHDRHTHSPFLIPRRKRWEPKTSRERFSSSGTEMSNKEPKKELPSAEEDSNLEDKRMSKYHFIETKMAPIDVYNSINSFHRWLKLVENDAYDKSGVGWELEHIRKLFLFNQDRMLKLDEKNWDLERVVSASQKLLNNHGREVSEFCLMWAFWMLEQRYYNLMLYSLDMDCILDRRLDVMKKGSTDRIPHPLEGLWSDHGEDMRPKVETFDDDYDIFWAY